jgi:predicted nucleic acid-binding protein
MPVIDTSAWIEFLTDSPLGQEMSAYVADRQRCMVPTLVQLELMKWLTRELSEEAAERTIAYTETCVVIPLDTHIALRAAELCREHKLATADAVIYATALELKAELVTCDKHFEGLNGVIYHPKEAR